MNNIYIEKVANGYMVRVVDNDSMTSKPHTIKVFQNIHQNKELLQ